jgi:CheY-like chemotaxis protein
MSLSQRILVVENNRDLCDDLAASLREAGYQVDPAYSAAQALERIRLRTYHLALVDLSLNDMPRDPVEPEDHSNLDGYGVIQAINDYQEGTAPVVLSGHPETQVAADSLQVHGARRFFAKQTIIDGGLGKLLKMVKEVLADVRLIHAGGRRSLLHFLSNDRDHDIWIDRAVRALDPTYRYDGLPKYMEAFFGDLEPLLPVQGVLHPLALATEGLMYGAFWSKALAAPFQVFMVNSARDWRELALAGGYAWDESAQIKEYNKLGVMGVAFATPGRPREDFIPSYSPA